MYQPFSKILPKTNDNLSKPSKNTLLIGCKWKSNLEELTGDN